METLLYPFHSISHFLHDVANVQLGNWQMSSSHNVLDTKFEERATSFVVSVPVPGMSKKDINVQLEGNVLNVAARRHHDFFGQSNRSNYTDVRHSFVLPEGIDADHIRAKCRDGLLTIYIDKIKSRKTRTEIKVLGSENGQRTTTRLNTVWNKLMEKLNVRRLKLNLRSN